MDTEYAIVEEVGPRFFVVALGHIIIRRLVVDAAPLKQQRRVRLALLASLGLIGFGCIVDSIAAVGLLAFAIILDWILIVVILPHLKILRPNSFLTPLGSAWIVIVVQTVALHSATHRMATSGLLNMIAPTPTKQVCNVPRI